jgi:hypothetical protein
MASHDKISLKEGKKRGHEHAPKQRNSHAKQSDIYCLKNITCHTGRVEENLNLYKYIKSV